MLDLGAAELGLVEDWSGWCGRRRDCPGSRGGRSPFRCLARAAKGENLNRYRSGEAKIKDSYFHLVGIERG